MQDAIRTGLTSTMNNSDKYLFRITYTGVASKDSHLQSGATRTRVYFTKYSSSWQAKWGNVKFSFAMYPPYHNWSQQWFLLDGPLLNLIPFPQNIFNYLHNLVIACENGSFYIDYVELSQMCETPLLIENHQFFSWENEMPYKSGSVLKAGFDVGSAQPNGDVIVYSGANVTFRAATSISLENGFTAEQGSNFETIIEPCDVSDPNRLMFTIDTIAPNTYIINDSIEIFDDHEETINCNDTIKLNGIDGDTVSYASYNWDFGNGQTSNDKSVNIYYNETGTYLVTLVLTDSAGVSDTLSKTYIVPDCNNSRFASTTTNIVQNNISGIQLFPNPTSGKINIILSKSQSNSDISIYDIFGNLIFGGIIATEPSFTLDISNHPRGIYFVKIVKDGQISINKLVLM